MDLMNKLLVIYYDKEFVLVTIQNNFFLKLYIYDFNSALCVAVPHAIRAIVPHVLRTVLTLVPHAFYILLYLTCLVLCFFSYCSCSCCA